MEIIDGIRIGIQIMFLDIWLLWFIFILANAINTNKELKKNDKKLDEQLELYNLFVEYQKAVDKKYNAIIEILNLKKEE